jgi:hypothetical protein
MKTSANKNIIINCIANRRKAAFQNNFSDRIAHPAVYLKLQQYVSIDGEINLLKLLCSI